MSFIYEGMEFTPHRLFLENESESLYQRVKGPYQKGPRRFDYEEFFRAAKAAGEENVVDLFWVNGDIVMPSSNLLEYKDHTLPDHFIRESAKTIPMPQMLQIIDSDGAEGFYPTPPELVDLMLEGLKWDEITTVLEPSAGKGDIIERMKRIFDSRRSRQSDIDCIEVNPVLRAVLKDKGYRVVYDDFLSYSTQKQYDLIVMNPPYSEADRHLLRALQMQRDGGRIVCLLNAETIRNPYSNTRKLLVQKLTELDARITFVSNAFSKAERKTDVEIALVRVEIASKTHESDIFKRMEKAVSVEDEDIEPETAVAPREFYLSLVRQYNIEVAAGVELIKQYKAMVPHMLTVLNLRDERHNQWASEYPILKMTVGDKTLTINNYLESVRHKYWYALLSYPGFIGKLTTDNQNEYSNMVSSMIDYDFNEFNILMIMVDINKSLYTGVETAIDKIFDQLSSQHSWYPESQKNIHYFNGWASNKAHKVNGKVVIPSHGLFPDYKWRDETFRVREAYEQLTDIEKVFNYLDGDITREVDLHSTLTRASSAGETKNIKCKFFDVTFYKKGTTHIRFTNQELLEKFNIYGSRKRQWLPPNYGRAKYEDMTTEEQAIIEEFQGKETYMKVMENKDYFLIDSVQQLSLPAASGE